MRAMNRVPARSVVTMAVLCLCAMLVGCGPSMGKYTITVTPSESLKADKKIGAFEVHMVGVSDLDAGKWREKKNSEYFAGSSNKRENAETYRMSFPASKRDTQEVKRNDAIWDAGWKPATSIFVFVSLPEATVPLELPRDTARWAGDTIELEVRQDGIVSKTPAKPK